MLTRVLSPATRPLSLLVVVGFVLIMVAVPAPPRTGGGVALARGSRWRFNNAESCMMHRINRVRARHGLRRLNWDKQLAYVSRRHARVMAANGGVFHDGNLAGEITRWRRLGQNSGRGGSCRRLSRAFMRSPSHRSNILGSFSHVGAGTEKRGGHLYAQIVFESRRDPGNVYHYP